MQQEIIPPVFPIRQAEPTILPGLLEWAEPILRHLGCTIIRGAGICVIEYPAGTTKQQRGLSTVSERFTITLPDGVKLEEQYDHTRNISQLYIPSNS